MAPQFDSFRNRTNAELNAAENVTTEFIEKSSSSVVVRHLRLDKDIKAALTRDHKEGADETILFTYKLSDLTKNVSIGDYLLYDTTNYLVYMEYILPTKLKSLFKKHKIIECNIQIKVDAIAQYGAYYSSLRSFSSTAPEEYSVISVQFDKNKAVVITKNNPDIVVSKRFMIGTESFEVVALDRISNAGIMYLSIEPRERNIITDNLTTGTAYTPANPSIPNITSSQLKQGSLKVIGTHYGYIKFSTNVEIKSRDLTSVTFIVPYGISSISISTKDINNNIVLSNYEVVI